jgi:hypothetical protein
MIELEEKVEPSSCKVRERERERRKTRCEIEKEQIKSGQKGRGRKVHRRRRLSSPGKLVPTSSLNTMAALKIFFLSKTIYAEINNARRN